MFATIFWPITPEIRLMRFWFGLLEAKRRGTRTSGAAKPSAASLFPAAESAHTDDTASAPARARAKTSA